VRASHLRERLGIWMARVREVVQAWWAQSRRHPAQPTPSEALDLWEARPLVTIDVEHPEPSPAFVTADTAEPDPCEMRAAHR